MYIDLKWLYHVLDVCSFFSRVEIQKIFTTAAAYFNFTFFPGIQQHPSVCPSVCLACWLAGWQLFTIFPHIVGMSVCLIV